MWRRFFSSAVFNKSTLVSAAGGSTTASPSLTASPILLGAGCRSIRPPFSLVLFSKAMLMSTSSDLPSAKQEEEEQGGGRSGGVSSTDNITCTEVKRLMRLVNVESLKTKLGMEGKETIPYSDLINACEAVGVARSRDEAIVFARVLDEAGVVLLFRDKVYLHPDKVVELVKRAMPLALMSEDDPVREELRNLQERKENIDVQAHKQVRRILWCGLGLALMQVSLFFRLTFWEFSWDVMEPIAFFATTTGIIVGYAYFLITSRDPTYQDLMKRLFLSRQRKLFKKHNFDVERFKELQKKLKTPMDATATIKNRVGMELELEDAIHKD